jgi:hypothetical protein
VRSSEREEAKWKRGSSARPRACLYGGVKLVGGGKLQLQRQPWSEAGGLGVGGTALRSGPALFENFSNIKK